MRKEQGNKRGVDEADNQVRQETLKKNLHEAREKNFQETGKKNLQETPERGVEELKGECERVFGKRVAGPSNFDEFSLRLRKATGRSVSVSTLKRIWGYVDYPHEPSTEVLSILAAFAGYRDWYDFRSADTIVDSSDFLGSDIVRASDLLPGARVQLRWKPDRVCVAEYLGNSEFRVTEAENGKLNVGDVFSCAVMAKGEPMICQDVRRGGDVIADGYVAGKTDGIISIMVMK